MDRPVNEPQNVYKSNRKKLTHCNKQQQRYYLENSSLHQNRNTSRIKHPRSTSANNQNTNYYYPQLQEFLPKPSTQNNSLISPRYFGHLENPAKQSKTEVIYKNSNFTKYRDFQYEQQLEKRPPKVHFADEFTRKATRIKKDSDYCTCHHNYRPIKETKSERFPCTKITSEKIPSDSFIFNKQEKEAISRHYLMQSLLGNYEKKKAQQERDEKMKDIDDEPNVDTTTFKVNQDYLRKMEEKIFNIKIDPDKVTANVRRNMHISAEVPEKDSGLQTIPTKDVMTERKASVSSSRTLSLAESLRAVHKEMMQLKGTHLKSWKGKDKAKEIQPAAVKSKGTISVPSDGTISNNSHNNMMLQLKKSKIFESQHQRFLSPNSSKADTSVRKADIVNVGTPPLITVEQSEVQMKQTLENEADIVPLAKTDSAKNLKVTGNARSSSVPPEKKPTRRRNPRSVDLFNPNYSFENPSHNFSAIGKGLLESIRTKVFGYKIAEKTENDGEWTDNSSICSKIQSKESMKFPKETRHAMSYNEKGPKLCQSCSQSIKNIKTIDAQTSPNVSLSKLKTTSPPQNTNKPIIPCHINLLCEKGLHIGKCEDLVREKIHMPACDKDCTCRFENNMQDDSNWPGKAKRSPEINNLMQIQNRSEQSVSTISDNDYEQFMESSGEDAGADLESKASMETFLKIMEPMSVVSGEYPKAELPVNACYRRVSNVVKNYGNQLSSSSAKTMNGLNGHTNGADLIGCGDIITQNQQKGCWTIGLINSKYRYLTAETFGFKINANGTSLKKKQIWTLEPENANGADSMIYLRSHLDKYLAVDSFGNVTCESEEKDPGSKFQISVSEDGSGRWALKNVVRGYFLGSTLDKLTCTAKVPSDAEFWHIHLAARPQVNLRSVGRKRFAHLSENLDEIHVDANIPWGEDTLFTLEFRLDESGKYAIHTCNNKYLSMGGKLVDACNKDCLFSAEYHSGQLALRDRTGAYLSPIGSKAVLKTRSNSVTKDELFSLEDSLPQASFVASLNSRFVSVKQGVDVTANQDEISDHETFQLEFDWSTKRWYIRTMQDRYWTLETGGGIQASGDKRSSNALFDLVWHNDGSLAFRANNGRYVITKRSGHLYATADTVEDNCKYYFYLINRPILVLKCEQGFVGYKSGSSPKLECNKATYESIQVERGEKGVVHFKGQNGKYWHVDSAGVTADSDTQEGFYLELREPTRLSIKTTNGNYLTASKNGLFRLGDTTIENATQWEY